MRRFHRARRFTAIDCFCGAGGFSAGLVRAGFAIRAAFDLDADSTATYSHHFRIQPLRQDVKEISGQMLLAAARLGKFECDLLVGGPPCQGFSRQRRGPEQDPRNMLILEFLRLVGEAMPRFFIMENVSAIVGPRGKDLLSEFQRRSQAMGYIINRQVLNAADYGVPQHRRRLFIVGQRSDQDTFYEFPVPTKTPNSYVTVRDAIGDLPSPALKGVRAAIPNHEMDNISDLNRLRISHVPTGGGRQDIPQHLRLRCHAVSVDKAGHRGVYGRLDWDKPAGTITTKCNSFTRGRFAHPTEHRNISMREAARLQSFEDDFNFIGDRVSVAHQVGNAVPVWLAYALGVSVIDALTVRPHGGVASGQLRLMTNK